ncbi:MAG: 3-deoxy-7-phosphoheptulonate synthase, partial [Muribaculaceae bacterium]|nr:3-deoxy-7-phosphoheptulonate synthase [Muribaculaceae bacterium]
MNERDQFSDLQPLTFSGISLNRPIVIAGPCSAESEEQVMTTARELSRAGVKIFRAGVW